MFHYFVPGVIHGKKLEKMNKKFENIKYYFLAYVTPRLPMSVHKKCQPTRFSQLAGHRKHIYECLVLLYRR